MKSSPAVLRRRAAPIAAVAALAASGIGVPVAAGATAPAAIPCSTKAIQPAIPGGSNLLYGVAVQSGCNALAVGPDRFVPVTLHWNGRSWRRFAAPVPAGSSGALLQAVAFDSPTTAWAVGRSTVAAGASETLTLIMRWNGRAWHHVKSPSPGGVLGESALTAVVATSPTNAMAVGFQRDGSQLLDPLAEVWNGHTWARIDIPFSRAGLPGGGEGINANLTGVATAPHGTAWAVGTYGTFRGGGGSLIYSYADGQFTQTTISKPAGVYLAAVASAAAAQAWAVGGVASPYPGKPVILEWNGTTWSRQYITGLPAGATDGVLADLTVASPSNAWAVGSYTTAGGISTDLIVHWNGTKWRAIPSANPGSTGTPAVGDTLYGVAGRSCATLWAVGEYVVDERYQHSMAVRC